MIPRYVLITAAKNEEKYILRTIQAVLAQTIKPLKWIIVSDRSRDGTDNIVKKAGEGVDFIQLVSLRGDDKRNFGSQVRAINKGCEYIHGLKYDYIGNLDADVSFEPRYFEHLFEKFTSNKKLGIGGGFIVEEENGKFVGRAMNNLRSVPHAIQMFRRECYEGIGGYVPLKYGGPDWCAEVMARMKGWEVSSFKDIKVLHHRPTTSAEGYYSGAFRSGLMDHSMGSHPIFEIIKCFRRIKNKPIVIGSILRLFGYTYGYFRGEPTLVSREVINYLRLEQVSRIKKYLYL